MTVRAIVLLTFICLSLPVCFFRPFYGIILWTIIAFLNPQSFTWNAASFAWAQAIAIPTLVGLITFSRGWVERLLCREVYLLVILWMWFCITSVMSVHTPGLAHHASDTYFRWGFVSKILLMTLVTIAIVDSFERLRKLVLVIAGCFGFFVLKALPFMISTGGAFRLYGPENSMIGDNNDFGLALNMTLPLFLFLAKTEPVPWVRRLFGLLFLITIPAIFFTYSRGALVGLAVISILMFLQLKQRLALIPVIAFGVLIALLLAPEAWRDRMDPTRSDAMDASARSRLNAWTFSWRLAIDYPLTGGGFDTFTPELFNRYAPNAADVHGPHSIYFGVLAEHGFFGLALYLLLVASCFLSLRQLSINARLQDDPVITHYSNMFRFSLIGFLSSGMFLGRAYFDYFFTIVACITVAKRVCAIEWASEAYDDIQAEEQLA